jgi:uncharacterized iron-regulated membrane protein
MMRALLLGHRYLGIAVGLLMVGWCLSGIVMVYVPYPLLTEASRVRHLPPIDWRNCCAILQTGWPAATHLQVEMLATHPVLRVRTVAGFEHLIDLQTGTRILEVSPALAANVAGMFAEHAPVYTDLPANSIDHDQWTVQGAHGSDRPLYRFRLGDSSGTELYVSSRSGKSVQITTARERFWNWLGSVPHWLYFSVLRQHASVWSQVVVLTSTLGCFLALTGLYVGIRAMKHSPDVRRLPYRGFHHWHHLLGLIFGVFILSWVASGLVSMNPWGFLAGDTSNSETTRVEGVLQDGRKISSSLLAIARAAPALRLVSIDSAPFYGRLFLMGTTADGQRIRLDEEGKVAPLPLTELAHIAQRLARSNPLVSAEMITSEDDYYFSHHREQAQLPAYRVILGNAAGTRFYVDPASGEILRRIGHDGRWYRWLHQALHRMDFSASLRASGVRDVLMIILLTGMSAVCAIGTYLGIRRTLTPSSRVPRRDD